MISKTGEPMIAGTLSRSIEIGLRFVGIWPNLSHGTLTWGTYMTSVAIALYFQYVYIFNHFNIRNISNLIDALSITISYSFGFLKLISLWLNRRILYNIVLAMEEDWDNVDHDRSLLCIMSSNANLSRRCSNVLISLNSTAAICYAVTSLMWNSHDLEGNLNTSVRVLPIKMELPFEATASPIFEIFVIVQSLHEVSIAAIVAMINSLIVTLVLHVTGQIDILRRKLVMICGDESLRNRSFIRSVKVLITRHQKIIILSDNIEELYSDIALMQFLANTVVICCIGLTIIASLGKSGIAVVLLKSAIFYVAVTSEAFIFCFAGEYLGAKSKSIGNAVYESLWYNMTPDECRILLFVILRSQRRLTITAGNIMDLSLEGFTTIMKASASYVSVLHAMY